MPVIENMFQVYLIIIYTNFKNFLVGHIMYNKCILKISSQRIEFSRYICSKYLQFFKVGKCPDCSGEFIKIIII